MRQHRFAAGEPVAYAEDGQTKRRWQGGYEIVRLLNGRDGEPQYEIRSANQSYGRMVKEHELCKELGSRYRQG